MRPASSYTTAPVYRQRLHSCAFGQHPGHVSQDVAVHGLLPVLIRRNGRPIHLHRAAHEHAFAVRHAAAHRCRLSCRSRTYLDCQQQSDFLFRDEIAEPHSRDARVLLGRERIQHRDADAGSGGHFEHDVPSDHIEHFTDSLAKKSGICAGCSMK